MTKIAIYAICGASESRSAYYEFLDHCYEEADFTLVLPTSRAAYGTVPGVSYRPFRFDDARNAALAMVPIDIDVCVVMDIDERLSKGWSKILREAWIPGATFAAITFDPNVNLVEKGIKVNPFLQLQRVHGRFGWRWRHPCHEALEPCMGTPLHKVDASKIVMTHHPDVNKPRPDYLAMLAWGQQEEPANMRPLFYYARELMFQGHYEKAIEGFELWLQMEREMQMPNPPDHQQAVAFIELCKGCIQQKASGQPVRLPLDRPV